MKHSIYLIGFMGCGKSTIGYKLSVNNNYPVVDLDRIIEEHEAKSIPDIFKEDGEGHFRKIETQMLIQTKHNLPSIIATGGGIVSQKNNRDFLKEEQTIYLEWDFETLYERIKNDMNRPKVKNYEQLKALYRSREAYYREAATYILACEGKLKSEIIREIVDWLGDEV